MGMVIRSFKDGKEVQVFYNLPPLKLLLGREFDFMNICDETKKCIVMFNFATAEMNNWLANPNPTLKQKTVVNAFVLRTDEMPQYDILYDMIQSRYGIGRINEVGVVNIIDAYRNVGLPKDKIKIFMDSFHDKHRLGVILTVPIRRQDMEVDSGIRDNHTYDFISSITANKLTLDNLKEKLTNWIKDTQRMHNFLNTRNRKVLEFDDFTSMLSIEHNIGLNFVFHKSYFQQFRSFVANLDIDRFSELFEKNDTSERYSRIWKDLNDVGQYAPTYNFKGIRMQPLVGSISTIFLGTSIKIEGSEQTQFKVILTALDMVGQLGTLEDQIERTKLINA